MREEPLLHLSQHRIYNRLILKHRLIRNYGYDEESANDVLNYVASIFARGDA